MWPERKLEHSKGASEGNVRELCADPEVFCLSIADAAPSLGRAVDSRLDSSWRLQGLRLHQKIVLHFFFFFEHLTALLSSTEE